MLVVVVVVPCHGPVVGHFLSRGIEGGPDRRMRMQAHWASRGSRDRLQCEDGIEVGVGIDHEMVGVVLARRPEDRGIKEGGGHRHDVDATKTNASGECK